MCLNKGGKQMSTYMSLQIINHKFQLLLFHVFSFLFFSFFIYIYI